MSVEKGYFDSIDDVLAVKADLQLQIPEVCSLFVPDWSLSIWSTKRKGTCILTALQGVPVDQLHEKCPDLYKQLHAIDSQLSGGCTAVVGLVYHNKLFVANVGKSQVAWLFRSQRICKKQ